MTNPNENTGTRGTQINTYSVLDPHDVWCRYLIARAGLPVKGTPVPSMLSSCSGKVRSVCVCVLFLLLRHSCVAWLVLCIPGLFVLSAFSLCWIFQSLWSLWDSYSSLLSSRLHRFAAASSSSSTRDEASVTSRELTLCGTPIILFFVSPQLRRPLPLCC